jgi:hypothetical protein
MNKIQNPYIRKLAMKRYSLIFSGPVITTHGSVGPGNIREYQHISWLSFCGRFPDVKKRGKVQRPTTGMA